MYVGGLLASLSEYGRAGRVSTFHARVGVHLCGNVALYGVHMHAPRSGDQRAGVQ